MGYRSAADTVGTHATMQLQGDSMSVQLQGRDMHFATKAGAIVYFNPSMGLLEQAVMRARALGGQTAEVPLFASEGGATVPLQVTWIGSDSARLSLNGVVFNVALGKDGRVTGMAVPSQNVRVVRVEGARIATELAKPDYSAPADAPYTAEDVTVTTAKGLKLTGTLTLPKARPARGVPAVVTITGSGTEERDESIPGVNGYRPFRQVADTLGRRGIAVLRLDDRGAGGSDLGPSGANGPTTADFADDIRAGLAYLRSRSEIDGTRLALVGHSEGGMIAPMVAATDPKLRALVLMAGPAQSGRTILKFQQEYAADSMLHLTGARRDSALKDMSMKLDSSANVVPWLHYFLDYDPIATAKRVKQPVLVLQGATDRQVTPEQGPALAAAFRAGGNQRCDAQDFSLDEPSLPRGSRWKSQRLCDAPLEERARRRVGRDCRLAPRDCNELQSCARDVRRRAKNREFHRENDAVTHCAHQRPTYFSPRRPLVFRVKTRDFHRENRTPFHLPGERMATKKAAKRGGAKKGGAKKGGAKKARGSARKASRGKRSGCEARAESCVHEADAARCGARRSRRQQLRCRARRSRRSSGSTSSGTDCQDQKERRMINADDKLGRCSAARTRSRCSR